MRKGTSNPNVLEIVDLAKKQGFASPYAKGDENWSLVEAAEIETPIGEVHLHWFNHRGRGQWRFSKSGTTVCKTVRCRIVTVIPHGGENECCPIDGVSFRSVQEAWAARKSEERRIEIELQNKLRRINSELMKKWRLEKEELGLGYLKGPDFKQWRETLI